MKKLFLSLVALVMATMSYAQSSMLATLSHEGNISTFYGASALKDAYNAAANGDVITLSSGSFNAVDIAKGLTIRGAGMGIDDLSNSEPTVITGDFKINIPSTVTTRLTLEGIYHNHTIYINSAFKNGTFLKSRFKEINYSNSATVTNLTMIHCKVASDIYFSSNSSASFVNCVIFVNSSGLSSSNCEFNNCIVKNSDLWYLGRSYFKNSILVATNSSGYLSSDAVAYNCVAIGAANAFENIPNTTNVVKNYSDVFKTFKGTYNDSETFELTETAKTTLKGLDGTQVGIYGGNMPFSATPSNPQITKCNVAGKSTADGKLSVDIEVNGAE